MIYVRSTDGLFNCYGYAFGTNEWERMFHIRRENDEQISFNRCLENIKKRFPLSIRVPPRVVLNKKYDTKQFYAVAFRVGYDKEFHWTDFHFMRQEEDGNWYQKVGSMEGIYMHEGSIMDVWERPDGMCYGGRIAFFLVLKD